MSNTHIHAMPSMPPDLKHAKTTTMKDKRRFKLIDGTFTPSEAKRILLSLVKSKMDFHSMEKAGNEERFGRDLSHSERRLRELRDLKFALTELLDSAADAGKTFRIDGWIEITVGE